MQISTEQKYLTVFLLERNKSVSFAYIPVNKYVTGTTIEALAESTNAPVSELSYFIVKDDAFEEAVEKNDIRIIEQVFANYRIPKSEENFVLIYGKKPGIEKKIFDEKRETNKDISYTTIFNVLNDKKEGVIGTYIQKDVKHNAYSQQN